MLKNYFKITFRNLVKQKFYSIINISGLSIGLAACILVGIFIKQEFEFDSHFRNADDIYRITRTGIFPSKTISMAQTQGNVKTTIEGKYPEILDVTRVYYSDDDLVTYNDKRFYEDNIIYADSTFFNVFSYRAVAGNYNDFLRRVNTVVLTESAAQKYFADINPIGQAITLNNEHEFEVVGVIEDVPVNSHFTFDFVATYKSLYDTEAAGFIEQWGATFGSYTYVKTVGGVNVTQLGNKITSEIARHLDYRPGESEKYDLQPIKNIHLYSHLEDEIEPTSSITNIIVISMISLFIILLAAINFINLTTARATKRAREIGVRKVIGAVKSQLVKQFLGESIIISLMSLVVALVLVELFRPAFINLVGIKLDINYLTEPLMLIAIFAAAITTGGLAGIYPSLVLSHFQPVKVLKGGSVSSGSGKGTQLFRKGLVLFQFIISIVLIIVTLMLDKQVSFMRNFNMGFQKDHTVILETPERMRDKYEAIKNDLNKVNGVVKTSACLGVPVYDSGYGTNLDPKSENNSEWININVKMIDDDYQDVFNLELITGRMLSELSGADFTTVTVVNEALVRKLGYSDPNDVIGNIYRIGLNNFNVEVVGVVKDFLYKSLHEEVEPLIFMRWRGLFQELAIKISSANVTETLKGIESVWNNFYPDYPFTYSFLDERVDKLYKADERAFDIIRTFSLLAIFIACLGLLGLTFYTAEQKKKEIGIKKVLGATVPNIVKNISFGFIKLVIMANVIAWPISYYLIDKWLDEFAYKTDIDIWTFISSGLVAVMIAFITISYTVVKSALANPVNALKYE